MEEDPTPHEHMSTLRVFRGLFGAEARPSAPMPRTPRMESRPSAASAANEAGLGPVPPSPDRDSANATIIGKLCWILIHAAILASVMRFSAIMLVRA